MEPTAKDGTKVPAYTAEFGQRIARAVELVGGLREAAKYTGTSEDTLANWRDGRARPSFLGMVGLANAAGVTLAWLATGEGDAPSKEGDASAAQSDAKPRRWTLWGRPAAPATPEALFGPPTSESDAVSDSLWERQKGEDLYGRAAEQIEGMYRTMGYNTSIREITNQAVRIARTIELAGGTPDQQEFALKVAVDQLRADLRRGLTDPINPIATKSRA